ncbi:MAG TPA: PIN domain-containing protein [Thermoplasmata archaeon]
MAFGDASYFIGILDRKDQWHAAAVRLAGAVVGRLRVTDVAMGETITLVGARSGGKRARQAYELLLDACDIVYTGPADFADAMRYHTRFDGRLSTSDCLTVAAMVSAKEYEVLSFDSDFDLVRGVERIH